LNIIGTLILLFVGTTMLASCGDDDDSVGGGSTADFTVTKTEIIFSKTGGTSSFSIANAASPEVSSNAAWCTVTKGSTTAKGTTSCTVNVTANTETDERVAVISVKVGSKTESITVTQAAEDGLIVEQTEYDVAAEGGQITVNIKANGAFEETVSDAWVSSIDMRGMETYTRKYDISANATGSRKATITYTLGAIVETVTINQASADMGNITASAADIAKLMYPGWNLGNTLEACDSKQLFTNEGGLATEMGWQKTKTSQAVIDAVRDAGFKSVRIPVSWLCGHVSGGTNLEPVIDSDWMARVKEIVNYCINDGLYVVLNDHWDGGWMEVQGFSSSTSSFTSLTDEQVDEKIHTLKYMWTQIANEFKDYDEHLLFAGLNEPFQEYSLFSTRHATLSPLLIKYNTAFVEAVRATGGNNAARTLVVQGPSVNIASSCTYMDSSKLPEQAGKLMVEVHYYDPGQFCGTFDSNVYFWGSGNHTTLSGETEHNATWGEEDYMREQFAKLKSTYTSKGYPVIMGEYAAVWRTISSDQSKHDASVKLFYKLVNEYGINNGIIPFAWDTNSLNNSPEGSMAIIDRAHCSVWCTVALDGIKEGVAAGQWPTESY
ncbi:MAG: cellulase family glycosylhydrolase, partial [Bacteroidaceae bacterium]|nr:cellulase family glycosylhydrolase [Bacteroidaceae bacterium]